MEIKSYINNLANEIADLFHLAIYAIDLNIYTPTQKKALLINYSMETLNAYQNKSSVFVMPSNVLRWCWNLVRMFLGNGSVRNSFSKYMAVFCLRQAVI